MDGKAELVHGTSVACGSKAALLTGPSGSGKSDLALRFISLRTDLPWAEGLSLTLVSDDQTEIRRRNGQILVSAPGTIEGKLEVRGIGIIDVPFRQEAELSVVVNLVQSDPVSRMLDSPIPVTDLAGVKIPTIRLAPFESSAPLKLSILLSGFLDKAVDNNQ